MSETRRRNTSLFRSAAKPMLSLPLAACATAPLSHLGALSSYDSLAPSNGVLTKSLLRVKKDDLLAAKTVRIVPTTFAAQAVPAEFSEQQRRLVLNAIDRSLCMELSERLRVVDSGEKADLTVHVTITHAKPTDKVAAGVSIVASMVPTALRVNVPVPVHRLPIGLGSLSGEAEARGRGNQQEAAPVWARGANSITSSPKISEVGDAYDLATAFGNDFGTLVTTGESPFGKLPSIPSIQKIGSELGGAHKDAACDTFGRSPGVIGTVGSSLGLPPSGRIKAAASAAPDTRLLLGARRPAEGIETGIETLPLDLASLASVRLFADALLTKLGDTAIDSLVLNAGVQLPSDSRTEDGFETTFATNQLAHYLLLRILLPKLAYGATVVITTSDTHAMIKKLDPEGWAHQQHHGFLGGMRAYASSKLCNLLTARALTMSETGKMLGLVVTAYTPGFTPDTTLFRHWPRFLQPLQAVVKLVAPVVRLSTAEQAGGILADLALGRTTPPAGRIYAALAKRRLTWPDPSELARSDAAARELWRASARMVGVSEDPGNLAA